MCGGIIGWAVFGFVIGLIARFLVPGEDPFGCFGTIALGVAGSVVGGFLGYLVFGNPYEPASYLGATLGAVVVLLIYRRFTARPKY